MTAICAWQVDEFVKRRGVLTLRRALPKAVARVDQRGTDLGRCPVAESHFP